MQLVFNGVLNDKYYNDRAWKSDQSFIIISHDDGEVKKLCSNFDDMIEYFKNTEITQLYEMYTWVIGQNGNPIEKLYVTFIESLATLKEYQNDEDISEVPFYLSKTPY